jgi:hypothetical protein
MWKSCLVVTLTSIAMVVSGGRNAHEKNQNPIVVTARARTAPIVAGRDAWYEITIKNVVDSDQILDLSYVVISGTNFIASEGSKGSGFATSDVNMLAPKCVDWTAFSVIKPGTSAIILTKIATPYTIQGPTLLQVELDLTRVVDLTNCRKDIFNIETKLDIQVQAP